MRENKDSFFHLTCSLDVSFKMDENLVTQTNRIMLAWIHSSSPKLFHSEFNEQNVPLSFIHLEAIGMLSPSLLSVILQGCFR